MGIISIDNVIPGMVLAEKVITSKNMMLLPEGRTLNENHLVTFKTWGITSVNIIGENDTEEAAAMSPEELKALSEEVTALFKHNKLTGRFTKSLLTLASKFPGISS
ncbi:MAG: hypothetical protein HRT88_11315 [Lentisphaeraceae bacterium]|nr:hypothetical protein [Lentisphaeraceae bacterium]